MLNLRSCLKKTLLCLTVLAVAVVASGCRSDMALNSDMGPNSLKGKSIALFTLSTSNSYKTTFKPRVFAVEVATPGAGDPCKYAPDELPGFAGEAEGYLISVEAQPGGSIVREVSGTASGPLICGRFAFPADARFDVPKDSVTYVGHIDMVNRQRHGNEPRSGPITPLIDQAVAGFSGGTFDIIITDKSATDIPSFVQAYPCLRDVQIRKAIMKRQRPGT